MTDWPRYKPGDPDPTIGSHADCPARSTTRWGGLPPFFCTWERGHEHPQHVAGTLDGKVAFAWDVEEP